jgi:decaprenylphospho-beta-D-erythro-pentofuranosid-2-ulose 2-reductase
MPHVLILGAKSDIAKALAHRYAAAGYDLSLAARNPQDLEPDVSDLKIRHNISAVAVAFDVSKFETHEKFYADMNPKPDGVICVVGYLGEQKKAEQNFSETKQIIDANYTGCVSVLNIIANDFESRKHGFIIGISSVAGDRGRQSNYIYGSAKAGFTAYLSGLRNRLFHSGVKVLTVKPGFMQTKMTENLNLPPLLTADPKDVASDVFAAEQKDKDVLYTKWFWKWIMLIITSIPESLFKKLKL